MTADWFTSTRFSARCRLTAAFWLLFVTCALAVPVTAVKAAQPAAGAGTNAVKVYTVNRKVADFPDQEDMSTPEAAYATLNRLRASGDEGFWRRLSAPALAQQMEEKSGKREVSADAVAEFMGAEILEVHLWRETNAVVIAQMLC